MKTMWAWYSKIRDEYMFFYTRKVIVEMCSPDGFESQIKRGEGEIVEVEVRHLSNKSSKEDNIAAHLTEMFRNGGTVRDMMNYLNTRR